MRLWKRTRSWKTLSRTQSAVDTTCGKDDDDGEEREREGEEKDEEEGEEEEDDDGLALGNGNGKGVRSGSGSGRDRGRGIGVIGVRRSESMPQAVRCICFISSLTSYSLYPSTNLSLSLALATAIPLLLPNNAKQHDRQPLQEDNPPHEHRHGRRREATLGFRRRGSCWSGRGALKSVCFTAWGAFFFQE